MMPKLPTDLAQVRRLAQELADGTGRVHLAVPRPRPRPNQGRDDTLAYAVDEADADAWERANHAGRFLPGRGYEPPVA